MKIEITPELLAELKEKAEKVTPGNLNILYPKDTDGMGTSISDVNGNIILSMRGRSINKRKFNSEYIAAANPDVILALIAKIEKLEKEADWLSLSLSRGGSLDPFCCPENMPYKPITECLADHGSCVECWREAAKKAVK